MSNILEISNLNKNYDKFAIKDVSFNIPAGYIMGFVGPNGAGKTTTIKSIANMINYQSGDIKIFGADHKDALSEIGIVMDYPFYVNEWKIHDVESAIMPFYKNWNKEKFNSLLKKFKIDKKKKVKELSRGMKNKLMMAVALSHDAKLLILDEPTSGLDPIARDEFCDMLLEFVADENKSVLFSTHITSDLEKIADYITFILNGRIICSDLKENLTEKYVMVKGGINEINSDQKKLIFGLREYSTGFEGIAEASNINRFPPNLLIDPATLDDIVIYLNKEANSHD